jgi:hypothetical protein
MDIPKAGGWPKRASTSSVPPKVERLERFGTIRTSRFASEDARPCHSRPANGPFQITSAWGDRQTANASSGDKDARLQTAVASERGDAQ